MFRIGGIFFCISYIIGLLSTAISSSSVHQFFRQEWTEFLIFLAIFTTLITIFLPSFWRFSPPRIWLFGSGIIILLAVIHFQLRLPIQSSNDISIQLKKFDGSFSPLVEVTGEIISSPRVTRNDKVKFILKTDNLKLSSETTEKVEGKLYVTLPLLPATGLYPSQQVTLKGKLYEPFAVKNLGSFDFKSYLFNQGIFAGFTANQIKINQQGNALNWGLWQLRNRIVKTHVRWLKVPLGSMISSIVLGRRDVDLSYEIQDLFIKVGLVHILAVSGFHVSLWLTSILFLTKGFSPKIQLIIGIFSLLIYPIFTGFYPSVLRAIVMGVAILIGIVGDRRINSLVSLLLAGTILLLINPLWIWDIGFELSFLATFGLIVTLPAIITRLDWLPPTIANLIGIPVAASIWVLPLQSYIFNTIPVYGIIVNIIVSPLVTIISLGGMVSALVGIIFPLAGSAIALGLYYPTLMLIKIAEIFSNLPGSLFAIGKISMATLIFCYGVLLTIWLIPWCQKRWHLVSLFLIIAVIIPIVFQKINLIQVTVLAAKEEPIIVIQNRNLTTLINTGDLETFQYNVLPFLANQGINNIDSFLHLKYSQNQKDIFLLKLNNIPTNQIFIKANSSKNITVNTDKLALNQTLSIQNNQVKLISQEPLILELNIFGKKWFLLSENLPKTTSIKFNQLKADILLWKGFNFNYNWLNMIKPKVAISYFYPVSLTMEKQLEKHQIKMFSTQNNGAIQYNPKKGFQPYLQEYDIIVY